MSDYPSWVDNVIKWEDTIGDYSPAENYLSIHYPAQEAHDIVSRLGDSPVVMRRANDILRAIRRESLPLSDPGVSGVLREVLTGKKLSPVVIAQDDIADGYHRVSLAYDLDPFANVPVKIAQEG